MASLDHRPRWVAAVVPLPFLLIAAGMLLSIWQNDIDFLRGQVHEVEAFMVDTGPQERRTSRPRFRPTFQPVAGGEPFTLDGPFLASELPPLGRPVTLVCSLVRPTRCRTPAFESPVPYYAMTGIWTLWSVLIAAVLWMPTRRGRRRPPA
jgi:hypothetical protein